MDYGRLTPLLVQSIQDLNTKFEARTNFIANAAPSPVLTVDFAGNVGVGTTTPAYKLHVMGDVAATGFINISTRDAKKDIVPATTEEGETALNKIRSLFVAHYRYNAEDASAPLRTGLIAEQAPEEVLSPDGKAVDLYKFVTFLASGMKALIGNVDGVVAKVASFAKEVVTEKVTAENINTNKLCIGNTCVTETELQSLLIGARVNPSTAPSTISIPTSPDLTSSVLLPQ